MAALQLKGVTKSFGAVTAVNNVTVEIPAGAFVSFLGPSGCGKTTTLRMIAGLTELDAGEIWVGERLLSSRGHTARPEERGMSMIFQSYALWPHMTAFENVAYGVKLKAALRPHARQRVEAMLDLVRMSELAHRYPGELSGGQQQRVALARALAIEPAVLLMDEPLSNLDANLREELRLEIRRLHDEIGTTTVYVTHDLLEAMTVSDRIAVMHDGRLEQLGTPEDIYERPKSRFVAGFMGQTMFVPATSVAPNQLRLGERGPIIGVAEDSHASVPREVFLALRPHDVVMSRERSPSPASSNWLTGTVTRQVYVGGSRDYAVRVDDINAEFRVLDASPERYVPGERVVLKIAPEKCRVLPRGPGS